MSERYRLGDQHLCFHSLSYDSYTGLGGRLTFIVRAACSVCLVVNEVNSSETLATVTGQSHGN